MKKALKILFACAMLAGAVNTYAADVASGRGIVNKIDAAAGSVNISHDAIPSVRWPAMTMDFKVADKKVLTGIKAGQNVTFGLTKDPKAGYLISHIESAK